MAKIKFDVSASDPEDSKGRGDIEQAPKGVYLAKFIEIAQHFAKDDSGKPDKSRPSLKVVVQPYEGKKTYGYVYAYISLGESSLWRLDQFLQALGLASKKKRTGELDPAKIVGKKEIGVRLKDGTDQNGERRAEVATWLDPKDMDTDDEEDEEDEETDDVEEDDDAEDDDDVDTEEESDDEESEESEDEDDEEDDEEEPAYTKADLKALDTKSLKKVAKEFGVKVKKDDKASVTIKAILKAQEDGDGKLPF